MRGNRARFERYRMRWIGNDPQSYAAINRMGLGLQLDAEITRIACPTLVVGCVHDPLRPPEMVKALAQTIPGARYVEAEAMLFFTQTGKVIHREYDSLELSKSPLAKGQALISPARLEQGVRFVGAAAVREGDRVAVLDSHGHLRLLEAGSVTGSGSIEAEGLLLSIGLIPAGA